MTLHLMKLCVGVETVEQLEQSQARRLKRGWGLWHDTRMMPKRAAEIVEGGSLYWVIRGRFQVRQAITEISRQNDEAGRGFARLHLDPVLHRLIPRSQRPFQGWRYLESAKAPQDRPETAPGGEDLPPEMQAELRALGIL